MRAPILVFVLCALGAGAFFLLRYDKPRDRRPPPADGVHGGAAGLDAEAVDRLARSIEELRSSVDKLNRRMDEWLASAGSRPARPSDAIVVDRLAVETGSNVPSKPAEAAANVHAAPDPERRKRLEELPWQSFVEVNRKHWFWTFEDAIQQYGPPDEIHPISDGQVNFVYRSGRETTLLQFYSGRLLVLNRSRL